MMQTNMHRRHALAAISGAFLAGAQPVLAAPFTLPKLPFALDALEPYLDARTMEIHHGKHHQAYVDNLNKALAAQPSLAGQSVEELLSRLETLPESIRTAVRNHGGGHANHSLFWQTLAPAKGQAPGGALAKEIDRRFGGYSGLEEKLKAAAMGVFGSGWAWLALDANGRLVVESTPNQDSPLSQGHRPVLGIDVWEHAYYLKFQNRRADYLSSIFKVVNWDFVSGRYEDLLKKK